MLLIVKFSSLWDHEADRPETFTLTFAVALVVEGDKFLLSLRVPLVSFPSTFSDGVVFESDKYSI